MDNPGKFIAAETIRFERLLPGPVERVWGYLTKSEKRAQWLASGEMELRIDGKVELHFNHDNLTPHDDPVPEKYRHHNEGSSMHGRITQLEPPKLLSYTWGESSGSDSEVTFKLDPQGKKVLLTLMHRRLGRDPELIKGIGAGWHTHLGILDDKLNSRTPQPFWAVHMNLEEQYEKLLAEKSR
jgi:uncharacterized protein YndB with AHSA1/START domain